MMVPFHWGNLLPAHIEHAYKFLAAAERLENLAPNGSGDAFSKPSLFLAAHSLELTLKCLSLWTGKCECELQNEDGHKLSGPYNRAKSVSGAPPAPSA